MSRTIKVYLNEEDKEGKVTGRKIVEAVVIKENITSFLVELPGGAVIKRKKNRDIVKETDDVVQQTGGDSNQKEEKTGN